MAKFFVNSIGSYLCRGLLLMIPFSKFILPGWVAVVCVRGIFGEDSIWHEQLLCVAIALVNSAGLPWFCRRCWEDEPRLVNFVAWSTASWYVGLIGALTVAWWIGDIARTLL